MDLRIRRNSISRKINYPEVHPLTGGDAHPSPPINQREKQKTKANAEQSKNKSKKKAKKAKSKKQKKSKRKALRKALRGREAHGTASEPGIMTTEEIRIPWRPYRPHHRTQGTGVARLPGAYQTAHCRKGTGSQSHWSPGSRS